MTVSSLVDLFSETVIAAGAETTGAALGGGGGGGCCGGGGDGDEPPPPPQLERSIVPMVRSAIFVQRLFVIVIFSNSLGRDYSLINRRYDLNSQWNQHARISHSHWRAPLLGISGILLRN